MKYVVDTTVINHLVDGAMQPEDLPSDGELIATHVQMDELNKTQDEERRARLFVKFATLKAEVVPTESLVAGVSRVGLCKLSDGNLYRSVKTALDERNNHKKNNANDALIAEVAAKDGYVLVTADGDLAAVAEEHGCKVLRYSPLTKRSSERPPGMVPQFP
jgi:rRNA-processing protein FCF1